MRIAGIGNYKNRHYCFSRPNAIFRETCLAHPLTFFAGTRARRDVFCDHGRPSAKTCLRSIEQFFGKLLLAPLHFRRRENTQTLCEIHGKVLKLFYTFNLLPRNHWLSFFRAVDDEAPSHRRFNEPTAPEQADSMFHRLKTKKFPIFFR